MKLFKWIPGRQPGVNYKKLCFLQFKIGKYAMDGYLLNYPKGTKLPFHIDPIDGKMWRLNITLLGKARFSIKSKGAHGVRFKSYTRKVNFFRSDIQSHTLTTYTKTIKLSFGFAKFM